MKMTFPRERMTKLKCASRARRTRAARRRGTASSASSRPRRDTPRTCSESGFLVYCPSRHPPPVWFCNCYDSRKRRGGCRLSFRGRLFPVAATVRSRACEAFSRSRREAWTLSRRPQGAFVTGARAQPPGRGLARTTAARGEAARLRSRERRRPRQSRSARCPRARFRGQKNRKERLSYR